MSENVRREPQIRIGARLRAYRNGLGWTLEQLAQLSGVTKGFLSRVERDMTSPSVATLSRLCAILGIPVGDVFIESEQQVVRWAETAPVGKSGLVERRLTPPALADASVSHAHVEPGVEYAPEPFTVDADTVIVHVLSGHLEVELSSATVSLSTGDTYVFEGREPHTWRNPDLSVPTDSIWVITPAPLRAHRRNRL